MSDTRRTFPAVSCASAASACTAAGDATTDRPRAPTGDQVVRALIEVSRASNAALMRGDIATYREFVSLTDDFSLMSPFGGPPTRGRDMSAEAWERMGRFFRNGAFEQEVVESYGSENLVVLAIIEHCSAEVGGLPHQLWPLRVTLVYRRDQSGWRLAHRHADPLVAGISHSTAAALARGDIR